MKLWLVWLLLWFYLLGRWFSFAFSPNTGWTETTKTLCVGVVSQWYTEQQATVFVNECKRKEIEDGSARRCVVWLTAIGVAESGRCKKSKNCFGLSDSQWVIPLTFEQAVDRRTDTYYKHRYKHTQSEQWINQSHYNKDVDGNRVRNTRIIVEYFRLLFTEI